MPKLLPLTLRVTGTTLCKLRYLKGILATPDETINEIGARIFTEAVAAKVLDINAKTRGHILPPKGH